VASVKPGNFQPKTRSRRDGSAVPLDELDKRLLNLMQGRFPLAPRPYAEVARLAEVPEEEVLSRVQHLLDERIIRQVTPIFDTRVLGYKSMLVAASVDPENPHRAARIVNSHPGVSHNYLRNHDFNMWFTIAVEPDSKLGLDGTLDVIQRETGADSIRQLPTLRLFKIRMDLEMEQGTEALQQAAADSEYREPEPIELEELDIAVIKALQGDLPVVPEPYAPSADELGLSQEQLLAHLESMQERRALRRVAHPVVEDLDAEPVHSRDDADLDRGGARILLGVRNRLGDNVVGDRLSRLVNPTRRQLDQRDRNVRVEYEAFDCFGETKVDQHGWMNAVSELPQFVDRELQLTFRLPDDHRGPLRI